VSIPVQKEITKQERIHNDESMSIDELNRKLLIDSYDLDTVSKEDIINYLQTILKYTYETSGKVKRIEKRMRKIEAKK